MKETITLPKAEEQEKKAKEEMGGSISTISRAIANLVKARQEYFDNGEVLGYSSAFDPYADSEAESREDDESSSEESDDEEVEQEQYDESEEDELY